MSLYLEIPIKTKKKTKTEKASFLVMLGIIIQNVPEGMATLVGTLEDIDLGILLAFAIAIHNIPEGMAVAIPVYMSTKNKKKSFLWSLYSGLTEPLGAIIVGLILLPFLNHLILSAMLAMVGGIMVYISIDELLPVSHQFGYEHISTIGIISGMFVLALILAII